MASLFLFIIVEYLFELKSFYMFIQYLLSVPFLILSGVPKSQALLGSGNMSVNETEQNHYLHKTTFPVGSGGR